MSFAKLSDPDRRIALIDCNNFYASCERVFHPAWNRRPVGVLSNNDGCLVALSNELKAAGIPMGAPYFKIRNQLRAMDAVVVSSNYTLYGDLSARVMETLRRFTPQLEVYSIDEAWLDLSGFPAAQLDEYARDIAVTVKRETGIPVSVGIAPTKVLAKLANRLCKKKRIPGQVFNLGGADSLDSILATVNTEDIWGIGQRWAKKLRALGIFNARQLKDADPEQIRQRFNVVMQRLVYELRGLPCIGFEDIEPKQQIIASRSFGTRVEEIDPLLQAVAMHATRAGEKLRSQQSICGALQAWICTGRHHPEEPYYSDSALVSFPTPTADTRQLIHAAQAIVQQIYQPGPRYAKAGVMLIDISPTSLMQLSLFDPGDSERSQTLMATVDRLNGLYGRHTLFFASEGTQKTWQMKRERMTPAYTTHWSALPVAHC